VISFFGRKNREPAAEAETLTDICVLGAFRCGTNFVRYLLERNYQVTAHYSAFGWKHAGVPVFSDGSGLQYPKMPAVFVVKNPYAFVLSLHKHFVDNRKGMIAQTDFDAFLTRPIVLFDSQLAASPQMRFPNPVQYWNFVYWNLENLDRERFRCTGFNHEDLIAEPDRIREVENLGKFVRRTGEIVVPQNQMRRLGPNSRLTIEEYETKETFDRAYYLERKYLDRLTSAQIAFISSEADPAVMQRRGYDIL
jgi:hypothetical protein